MAGDISRPDDSALATVRMNGRCAKSSSMPSREARSYTFGRKSREGVEVERPNVHRVPLIGMRRMRDRSTIAPDSAHRIIPEGESYGPLLRDQICEGEYTVTERERKRERRGRGGVE